ncbi:DUF2213 domain-containing protein [Vibrio lentus]|uniref:DUF2213 domain-containing protein n=2 Tax=Vibrio lentus TaxID=136468 RepID=UPI001D03BA3A|nr:DUF2213 domain-containing protein [Vibrio lentus]MCB5464564.1 DUF2213 domain-containing protein [Vibrio lentus]MCC4849645.1 DUF2213 domain-containing protein [Vibrio lentus]
MEKINQITCDSVTREKTPEGYLKVIVRAGRTGIQRYSCSKSGLADVNGTGYVNVLRHPDDVFNQVSLDSLHGKDITFLHPESDGNLVTSKNFKKLSKGAIISPGKKIDNDIYLEGIVKDEKSIHALDHGFEKVSLGYKNDYIREDGEWDGVNYHYRQKNIFYNHLALVPKGRAGEQYVVLDEEDSEMDEQEKADLAKEIAGMVLTQINTPAQEQPNPNPVTTDSLDKLVEEREKVVTKAKQLKPDLDITGKTNVQIMRECVAGSVTVDHSDEIVKYAFDAAKVESSSPSGRTHNPVILSGPSVKAGQHITTDSNDIIQEANELFKASTNRGFDSLKRNK